MGLFDFLTGKQKQTSTAPTPFETLPGFGQELLQDIITQGRGLSGNASMFTPTGFNAQQMGAINQLMQGVGMPNVGNFNFGQRASDAFNLSSALSPVAQNYIAQGAAPITGGEINQNIANWFNPFVEQALQPTLRGIRSQAEGLGSDIRSQASNAGAFGGSRQALAEAELNKNVLQQLSDTIAQGFNTGFNNAAQLGYGTMTTNRSNALNAGNLTNQSMQGLAGLGNALMGARMNMDTLRNNARNNQITDLQNIISAGDLLRTQQDAQNQVPINQLNFLSNLFKLIPGGEGGTTTTSIGPSMGGLLNTVGAIGGGLNAAGILSNSGKMSGVGDALSKVGGIASLASLFSDRSLKESIRAFGTYGKHKLYEFSYKVLPGRKFIGVLADEVEKYLPEAVTRHKNGYKMVNYDMLGLEMMEVV